MKAYAAALVVALAGCSDSGSAACAKARECCGRVGGLCDSVNAEGEGFEERCGIGYGAAVDSLETWGRDACAKIADAYTTYLDCLGQLECADVADDGAVPKCASQAGALCQALRESGDGQCGGKWADLSCDKRTATFKDAIRPESGRLDPSGKVDKDDGPTDKSGGG